jgi:spermidine/putrescine transport system ATP-binding protein
MSSTRPAIEIDQVWKSYGTVAAVNGVSLAVGEGEFVTLLGPSGCGKSTLLRMVAGFIDPTAGDIRLHGQSVIGVPPYRRNTSMVFQDYALFPHRTVAQNVAFGLRMRKTPKADIVKRVAAMLDLLGLSGMNHRRIGEISGGQQQRVALGRALVVEPAVLLLDEPLGALDFKLRKQMQSELKAIQRRVGITFIYVTHDQEEALTMSDRVAVMNAGRIEQCDTPEQIYRRPRTAFVADFVGEANLLLCRVAAVQGKQARIETRSGEHFITRIDGNEALAAGEEIRLVIRPESISIDSPEGLCGTVDEVMFSGATAKLAVELSDGSRMAVSIPAGQAVPAKGTTVRLSWAPENAVVLP